MTPLIKTLVWDSATATTDQGSVELSSSCVAHKKNKCTKHQFIHLLTATLKNSHIENSKNY